MKHPKYHKIRQFRDIIKDIIHQANFQGLDDEGNAIYKESEKPTLTFTGTTKLHGTNALITYTSSEGLRIGKRNSLMSNEQLTGHMGFVEFVNSNKEKFLNLFEKMSYFYNLQLDEQLTLYGEWAGNGIQKSVGISLLPKFFYIFDLRKSKINNNEIQEWLKLPPLEWIKDLEIKNLYDVRMFPNWEIEIDFNNPQLSQNKLQELTLSVEKQCPVAKQLGVEGIGEGIVWKTKWKGQKYIFKVKGDKHSTSKVKTLASIDPELLKSIDEFVRYSATPNRIKQGIKEVDAQERKDIGKLIKWVTNDILSEEQDVLSKNNLEWKQVVKNINTEVRKYYFKHLDTI